MRLSIILEITRIGNAQKVTAIDAVDNSADWNSEQQPRQHAQCTDRGDQKRIFGEGGCK